MTIQALWWPAFILVIWHRVSNARPLARWPELRSKGLVDLRKFITDIAAASSQFNTGAREAAALWRGPMHFWHAASVMAFTGVCMLFAWWVNDPKLLLTFLQPMPLLWLVVVVNLLEAGLRPTLFLLPGGVQRRELAQQIHWRSMKASALLFALVLVPLLASPVVRNSTLALKALMLCTAVNIALAAVLVALWPRQRHQRDRGWLMGIVLAVGFGALLTTMLSFLNDSTWLAAMSMSQLAALCAAAAIVAWAFVHGSRKTWAHVDIQRVQASDFAKYWR